MSLCPKSLSIWFVCVNLQQMIALFVFSCGSLVDSSSQCEYLLVSLLVSLLNALEKLTTEN